MHTKNTSNPCVKQQLIHYLQPVRGCLVTTVLFDEIKTFDVNLNLAIIHYQNHSASFNRCTSFIFYTHWPYSNRAERAQYIKRRWFTWYWWYRITIETYLFVLPNIMSYVLFITVPRSKYRDWNGNEKNWFWNHNHMNIGNLNLTRTLV